MIEMLTAVSERSCARARRALSLVLDYEADASEVHALAVHLGSCGGCRRYAAEVSAFTRDLRRSQHRSPSVDITNSARRENGNG